MNEEGCKGLAGFLIQKGGGVMAVGSRRLHIGEPGVIPSLRAGDAFVDINGATPDLVWQTAKAMESTNV